MAFFDLPLEQLKTYRSPDPEPADFDAFWSATLKEARTHPLNARFEPVKESYLKLVDVHDVTFNGYGGQPIKGWFIEPAGNRAKLPCLVTYIGYGGGRSLPVDHMLPSIAGMAHLVMDTRGQGSSWSPGNTPDSAGPGESTAQYPGFMTRGVESREGYYYRRVFTDAARAVEVALGHAHVDPARVGVTGGSQGGGIAIAAAALSGSAVKIAMPDVPFLCQYRRAAGLVDTAPYSEIGAYLKTHRGRSEQVFQTLAYFDGVNFAPRIKARCLFSVALMDNICPPSTVFAAYNRVEAAKEIRVYDFNNHEGGAMFQATDRLRFATSHL